MAPRVPSSHQRQHYPGGRDALLPSPPARGDEAPYGAEEALLLRDDWAGGGKKTTGRTEEDPPSSSNRMVDRHDRPVSTHHHTADGGGLAALPSTTATTIPTTSDPWNNPAGNNTLSLLGGLNSSMYGGGLGGVGPYGASGGYPFGMGMGMGMGGMMGMGGGYYGGGGMALGSSGPLASFNQFLFGVQAVIFSLGQAVQIVGMNAHALQQLLDAAFAAFDRATTAYRELRSLEASGKASPDQTHDDETRKRLRRLQALRWTMVVAATYGGYRLVRRLLFQQRHRPPQHATLPVPSPPPSYYSSTQGPSPSYPYSATSYTPPYAASAGASPYGGPSSGYGPTTGAGTYGPYY